MAGPGDTRARGTGPLAMNRWHGRSFCTTSRTRRNRRYTDSHLSGVDAAGVSRRERCIQVTWGQRVRADPEHLCERLPAKYLALVAGLRGKRKHVAQARHSACGRRSHSGRSLGPGRFRSEQLRLLNAVCAEPARPPEAYNREAEQALGCVRLQVGSAEGHAVDGVRPLETATRSPRNA